MKHVLVEAERSDLKHLLRFRRHKLFLVKHHFLCKPRNNSFVMRPLQVKRKLQLEALDFPVFCVDSFDQIKPVIQAIRDYTPGDSTEGVGAKIPMLQQVMAEAEQMGDVGFMEYDEFARKYGDPFPEFHQLTEEEIRQSEDRLM